jgi:hypothetical protein
MSGIIVNSLKEVGKYIAFYRWLVEEMFEAYRMLRYNMTLKILPSFSYGCLFDRPWTHQQQAW